MDFITIVAVALGLSFDTFAVSLSFGVVRNRIIFRDACRFGFLMAVFQAGFLVVGYFLGSLVSDFMKAADHWVALVLLAILGIRMVISGLKNESEKDVMTDYNNPMALVSMGVGTSIDAFAVGISFALLSIRIWYSAIIIGAVTFLASMTAIRIGKSAGTRLGRRVEIIGGLILIAIGLKIFLEHVLGA
ncbi:MAG TPA: manganese efflux pump MntP family protein [Desulfobacter postgatei]|nr:manganese efflux pump MntP family protein [Desulfobacter postgatei]